MDMNQYRKKQQSASPTKTTTGGDRVIVVNASKDADPQIQQAIEDHYHGKETKKAGTDLFEKSKYLQRIVRQRVLADRAEDRPKRYEFKGNVLGVEHTVKVIVKTSAYKPFDDGVRHEIEQIGVKFDEDGKRVGKSAGEQFLERAVTQTTVCKVDFSLIPEDKKNEVFAHLLQVNQMCGITEKMIEDGTPPIAEIVFSNAPTSEYHNLRTLLTAADDKQLDRLTPAPLSF